MQADPVKTLTEVLDFLGLDLLDPEGEKVRTQGTWRRMSCERATDSRRPHTTLLPYHHVWEIQEESAVQGRPARSKHVRKKSRLGVLKK